MNDICAKEQVDVGSNSPFTADMLQVIFNGTNVVSLAKSPKGAHHNIQKFSTPSPSSMTTPPKNSTKPAASNNDTPVEDFVHLQLQLSETKEELSQVDRKSVV